MSKLNHLQFLSLDVKGQQIVIESKSKDTIEIAFALNPEATDFCKVELSYTDWGNLLDAIDLVHLSAKHN